VKPPRGLLTGDRVARREFDRVAGALEARGLRLPPPHVLGAYCKRVSRIRQLQREAKLERRRGDVRMARQLEREARAWLDSLGPLRERHARTPAERRIWLGLTANSSGKEGK
jgi:hypothetical protein